MATETAEKPAETPAAAEANAEATEEEEESTARTLTHITIKEREGFHHVALVVWVENSVEDEKLNKALSDLASPVVKLAEAQGAFALRDDRMTREKEGLPSVPSYTVVEITKEKQEPKVRSVAPGPKRLNTDVLLTRMRELKAEHGRVEAFKMACKEQNLTDERIKFLMEEFGIE